MASAPNLEALKEWAEKSPDRWAQAVAIFSRASGYTEKAEMIHHHDVSDLSDSDLMQRLAELNAAEEKQDTKPGTVH